MLCEDAISTRTALSYHRRYFIYYKFRLRVFICTSVCIAAIALLVACFIVQVSNSSTLFPKDYELAESDMRTIQVSTVFCQGIAVKGAEQRRTLRIVKDVQIAPQTRVSNVSVEVFVSRGKYWFKAYYLLQGSAILVNAQADSFFKLFIFKRRSTLDSWIAKVDMARRRRSTMDTGDKATRISYDYRVPQDGNYYILFQRISDDHQVVKLSAMLIVTRRVYDLQNTVHECEAGFDEVCTARLMFDSNEKALIEVKQSHGKLYLNNIITTWYCQPRVWFFVVVFAGGFLLCLTLGFLVYVVLMNRRRGRFIKECRKQRSHSFRSVDSASLLLSRGSVRSAHASLMRQDSRTASIRSHRNDPVTGTTSQTTRLPPVVPSIYTGDLPGDDVTDNAPTTPPSPRPRLESVDTISLASLDLVSPRRASFSTFPTCASDVDTESLRSCPGTITRRHSYRNPHHPGYYRELKREREQRAEMLREVQRDRETADEAERESLLGQEQDGEFDGARDGARKYSRERETPSRERDYELSDREAGLRDRAEGGSCPRHSGKSTLRDFYRDLERERKRSRSDSDHDNRNSRSSDYEREFEKVLEADNAPYASHRRSKGDDYTSQGLGENPATLPRTARSKKPKGNGYLPQIYPIWQQQNDQPQQVHTLPNGGAKQKRSKPDENSNTQVDVKLRTLPSRKKEGFWKPRLSVVSEI